MAATTGARTSERVPRRRERKGPQSAVHRIQQGSDLYTTVTCKCGDHLTAVYCRVALVHRLWRVGGPDVSWRPGSAHHRGKSKVYLLPLMTYELCGHRLETDRRYRQRSSRGSPRHRDPRFRDMKGARAVPEHSHVTQQSLHVLKRAFSSTCPRT